MLLVDLIIVNVSEILSYLIRLDFKISITNLHEYFNLWLFITVVRILCFYYYKLYKKYTYSIEKVFVNIFKAVTISSIIIMAVSYFNRVFSMPRSVVFYSWVLNILFLFIARIISIRLRKPINILFMDAGAGSIKIIKDLLKHPFGKWNIKGFIDNKKRTGSIITNNIKVAGNINSLPKVISENRIRLVVIAIDNLDKRVEYITACEKANVNYLIIPGFHEIVTGRIDTDNLKGLPIVEQIEEPLNIGNRFIKRVIDITVSVLLIILFLPLMLVIAVLIKIGSPGEIIYSQMRVGKNGIPFNIYKFRTMIKDADMIGPKVTMKKDNRITVLGKFLRKTSLDEFPQFINVLKGDMSFIGPRPEIPSIVKNYKEWQKESLKVKPGITGLAQISGRSDLDIPAKLKFDLYYIENYSILLDIKILIKTPWIVLKAKGVF